MTKVEKALAYLDKAAYCLERGPMAAEGDWQSLLDNLGDLTRVVMAPAAEYRPLGDVMRLVHELCTGHHRKCRALLREIDDIREWILGEEYLGNIKEAAA